MEAENAFRFSNRLTDYPDPFVKFSNMIYPRTVGEVFHWAEWMATREGLYTSALKKCVRYFLGEVELYGEGVSTNVRRKYTQFLLDNLNLLDTLGSIGDNFVCFGNSMTSVHVKINRSLACKQCGASRPLVNLTQGEDYTFKGWAFHGKCPACGTDGQFARIDAERRDENDRIAVIEWAPQYVAIKECSITGDADYYYDFPPEQKQKIREGDHVYLCNLPWEIFETVKNNVPFKFNKDNFKHIKTSVVASMIPKVKGWGLPLFMANFSEVVHLSILQRMEEAVALEYIMPFRVITPPQNGGPVDPLLGMNMGNFMGQVRGMLKEHKMDPTTWHTLPIPLNYQALGGEAKAIAPTEQIAQCLDNLFTSMGVPQEMYKTSMSLTGGPPISLRMFERLWSHHTTALDDWLNFFLRQCSRVLGWERVNGRLVKTSVMEDSEAKQTKLNLASANIVSRYTALKAFGINAEYESDRMREEQKYDEEKAREMQAESEKAQMLSESMKPQAMIPPNAMAPNMGLPAGQAMPPQGAPMGPGPASSIADQSGGMGTNPALGDLIGNAQALAQQLMVADPLTRRRELLNLKKGNPSLHALVKSELGNLENGAASAGVQMARSGAPM